jgi:uncharacterized protein (TIGR02271 family)
MATKTMNRTAVVGVFDNRSDAQAAVQDLKRAGFRDDEIGVLSRDVQGDGVHTDDVGETNAAEGAAVGVAAGAGVGALWAIGIAAGLLPAIGPVIAGGLFASILASAAGGAAIGGLVGALIGLGITEEEAAEYEEHVKSGRTIVTVKTATRQEQAEEILRRHGGFERHFGVHSESMSDERMSQPSKARQTDRRGMATTEEACDVPAGEMTSRRSGDRTVELKKEEVHPRKEQHQAGEVRLHKEVVTERKTMDVPVTREEVVIERKPVAPGTTSRTTANIQPGEEIRVPLKEEHVRVEKTPVVTEQVSVSKRQVQDTQHVSADARREELRVEKRGDVRVEGASTPKQPRK